MLLSWFCWIIFSCFLAACWVTPKQQFRIIYQLDCKILCLWVLNNWKIIFLWYVSLMLHDFRVLYCCFHIHGSRHLLKFLLVAFRWDILFVVLLYERFLWPSIVIPTPHFLIPLMEEFLSFCLWFLFTVQATGNLSFVFQKVALQLKFVISPLLINPGLIFWARSI